MKIYIEWHVKCDYLIIYKEMEGILRRYMGPAKQNAKTRKNKKCVWGYAKTMLCVRKITLVGKSKNSVDMFDVSQWCCNNIFHGQTSKTLISYVFFNLWKKKTQRFPWKPTCLCVSVASCVWWGLPLASYSSCVCLSQM